MSEPQLTQEEYINEAGAPCPNCGETRFVEYILGWRREYGPPATAQPKWNGFFNADDRRGNVLRRKAMCGGCKAQWHDEFTLTGYSDLIAPELPMLPSEAWQGLRKLLVGWSEIYEISLTPKAKQALGILDEHWQGCAKDGE